MHERVFSKLLVTHSLFRVLLDQALDQIAARLRNYNSLRQRVIALLDFPEQLSLNPSLKWQISCHHLEENDAEGPKVGILRVAPLVVNLRSLVNWCPNERGKQIVLLCLPSESEVSQLELPFFRQ